jgi:hypothetical protein
MLLQEVSSIDIFKKSSFLESVQCFSKINHVKKICLIFEIINSVVITTQYKAYHWVHYAEIQYYFNETIN